jgi:hypothetical protein
MMLFIAIDDTDNLETMGTGRLSRLLAVDLHKRGLIGPGSVTRHQLLVHRDIPYTSHNSASCIAAETAADLDDVFAAAREFMQCHLHEGANPGLCLAPAEEVPAVLGDFGRRAQSEVIPLSEGYELAGASGLRTWRHGPTGQGIIGAMSAVGLRSTGQDGRFIDLAGIRKVDGELSVAELLERTGVQAVATPQGRELDGGEIIDTLGWVRPSLRGGRAVFLVARYDGAWRPALKRKKDEDDGQATQ